MEYSMDVHKTPMTFSCLNTNRQNEAVKPVVGVIKSPFVDLSVFWLWKNNCSILAITSHLVGVIVIKLRPQQSDKYDIFNEEISI